MAAPAGASPSIPEGSLVLFDAGAKAIPGKLVLALLTNKNETTFKKLVADAGEHYLQPLNPAYPLIKIDGICRILGVAVELRAKL